MTPRHDQWFVWLALLLGAGAFLVALGLMETRAGGQNLSIQQRSNRVTVTWTSTNFIPEVKNDLQRTNWQWVGNMTAVAPQCGNAGYTYSETGVTTQAFFRLRTNQNKVL